MMLMRDVWFVVALIWIVMAFRTKRTVRRVRGPWPVVFLVGVIAVGVIDAIAGPGGHRARWIVSSPVSVVATTMVFLGAIFAIWARLTIGSNWSGTVSHKESHELVVSGPYRFARHPIYTGLFFMALGTTIEYAEFDGFVFLAVAIIVFAFKIRVEEGLMMSLFPDQYPAYRRRVKAIIPFVL